MNEEFLYYCWSYQLIQGDLITTDGEIVKVISPGTINTDSGPDFFNALIDIGQTRWAGNVEVHIASSDWYRHNHQKDALYDNIILHVVLYDDMPIKRNNKETIPTLVLQDIFSTNILDKYNMFISSTKEIPCGNLLYTINKLDTYSWFDNLMVQRLEKRSKEIQELLINTKGDLLQAYYQKLSRSLGYTVNSDSMEMLAIATPLKIILKHIDNKIQVEALLFGQSGLLKNNLNDPYSQKLCSEYNFLKNKYSLMPLEAKIWRFMRMRPTSFPTIRISQLATIICTTSGQLTKMFDANSVHNIRKLLSLAASSYWDNHYRFDKIVKGKPKKLGESTINTILINTIIPFLFIYGKLKNNYILQQKAMDWLTHIKYEKNKVTREFISYGIVPSNATESQALLQLKTNYCSQKLCLRCRFGFILLNEK